MLTHEIIQVRHFAITEKGIALEVEGKKIALGDFDSKDALLQAILQCFPFSNDIIQYLELDPLLPSTETTLKDFIKNSQYLKDNANKISQYIEEIETACEHLWEIHQKIIDKKNKNDLKTKTESITPDLEKIDQELYTHQRTTGFLGIGAKQTIPGLFSSYQNFILNAISSSISNNPIEINGVVFQILKGIKNKNQKKEIFNQESELLYDVLKTCQKIKDNILDDDLKFMLHDLDERSADIQLKATQFIMSDEGSRTNLKEYIFEKYSKKYSNYFKHLEELGMQYNYDEQGLSLEIKKHLEINIELYFQMEMLQLQSRLIKIKQNSLEEKNKLPKKSKEEADEIKEDLKQCDDEIKKLETKQKEILEQVEAAFTQLTLHCFKHTKEDLLNNSYRKLGLIRPSELADIQTILRKTWLEQFSDWYQYIPSFSGFSRVAKSTFQGATIGTAIGGISFMTPITATVGATAGFALGTVGGISGATYNVMASTGSYVKTALVRTLYGKYHGDYSSENYKPNKEMISTFDGDPINAAIVNAFYVNQIFELDVVLSNLSETQQKEKSAQDLHAIFTSFKEHYQKLRTGQYKNSEAKDIFKKDLSIVLMMLDGVMTQCQISTNRYALTKSEQEPVEIPPLTHSQELIVGTRESSEDKEIVLESALNDIQSKELDSGAMLAKIIEKVVVNDLVEFNDLIDLSTTFIIPGQGLSHLDAPKHRQLKIEQKTKSPLNRDLLFYLKKSFKNNTPAFIILYYYELFSSNTSLLPTLKKEMNTPLPDYEGKSFWHLMVDWEKGPDFIEELNQYKGNQEFGAFFNPSCTYSGMNALEYALSKKNYRMARIFMQQIIKSPNTLKDNSVGLQACFKKALEDPELRLLANILYQTRKEISDASKSYFGSAKAKIGAQLVDTETEKRYEILAALWLYKEQHAHLPETSEELKEFLQAVKDPTITQNYLTVNCFTSERFNNALLPKVAAITMEKLQKHRSETKDMMEGFIEIKSDATTPSPVLYGYPAPPKASSSTQKPNPPKKKQ